MFDLIVVDSIAGLSPETEIRNSFLEKTIGEQARLMSRVLRNIIPLLYTSRTTLILINQLREKIGNFFGNPEITPGGKALRFYASIRMEIRKIENIIEGNKIIGQKIRIKIIKNKLSNPYQSTEVKLIFGKGISVIDEIIDLALMKNIIIKKGS